MHRFLETTPVGEVIGKNIRAITPGPPVYTPFKTDIQRKDLLEGESDGKNIFEMIYEEGVMLAGSDRIPVNENTDLVIFNTSVASPHSVFKVPYNDFDAVFREKAHKYGVEVNSPILIAGQKSTADNVVPPSHVPLDMLVWIMKVDKITNRILPVDLNDLLSSPTGKSETDRFRLGLSMDQIREVFATYVKRSSIATETLLDLHNNVVRRHIPFLPEKNNEDIMQGIATGYYRGDPTKGLEQYNYDGLGKGSPSNPSAHGRNTDHLSMQTLNKLNIANPNMTFYDFINLLKAQNDVFGDDIVIVPFVPPPGDTADQGQVLQDLIKTLTPADILKTIDPFATVFHDTVSPWLIEKLRPVFADMSPVMIREFRHHSSDFERELRVSEGIEIVISGSEYTADERKKILAETLARLTYTITGILSPLWEDVKEYVTMKTYLSIEERSQLVTEIKEKHDLNDDIISHIKSLQPTEKQLQIAASRSDLTPEQQIKLKRKLAIYSQRKMAIFKSRLIQKLVLGSGKGSLDDLVNLIYLEQYIQIFDGEGTNGFNTGANMPGVPSHGITHHEDEDGNIHVNLGWLMATKGLAEAWLGAPLKRLERKG